MKFSAEELQVINAVKYFPMVSVIVSIKPEIGLKAELAHKLKIAVDKIKRELQNKYPEAQWMPVFNKLANIVDDFNYETATVTTAIFVSPLLSKVFHLQVPVEDKIVINESFEVRDLVYANTNSIKYLVLLLTGKIVKAYEGRPGYIQPIKLDMAERIEAYDLDMPGEVANFSDPDKHKEILQDKFLKEADKAVSKLLKTRNEPLVLIGVDRLIGHFKSVSQNTASIAGIIHGNYDNTTIAEMQQILKPYEDELKMQYTNKWLREIEKALNANKLDFGIEQVWKSASENQGRVLIVERNFMYPAYYESKEKIIHADDTTKAAAQHISDAVDDVIVTVLQNGGEVVFVDESTLNDYQHIALLKYY
ncbi:MAG: baeRF3 domain-containing protein [Flavipsychrobacter sp.]